MDGSLSCFASFSRVPCRITLAVFLRGNHFKRLILPEHRKDDVADFVHHSPDSHALFLDLAFVGIVAVDDGGYRHAATLIHLKVVECYHVQDAPGQAGSPFRHMHPVPVEFPGLLNGRGQAEIGIQLLRGREQVKSPHFRDQDNSAHEACATQRLEKKDAAMDRPAFQAVNGRMDCFHDCVEALLVFPVRVYVEPDVDGIAFQGSPKDGGIFCGGMQGIIFC